MSTHQRRGAKLVSARNWSGSESDAKVLAQLIENYWKGKGFEGVKVWVQQESHVYQSGAAVFGIRSNIKGGVPPRENGGTDAR